MWGRSKVSAQTQEALSDAVWNPQDVPPYPKPSEMSPEMLFSYSRELLVLQFTGAVERELERRGWGYGDLASRMGVSEGRVAQILWRHHKITAETMASVATALGLQLKLSLEPLD